MRKRARVGRWLAVLSGVAVLAGCGTDADYEKAAAEVEEKAESIDDRAATVEELEAERKELEARLEQERKALAMERDEHEKAKSEATATATDALLLEKVEEALDSHPLVEMARIGVRVEGGVAVLSGTTDTDAQREKAIEIVGEVPGVTSVRSELASRESAP